MTSRFEFEQIVANLHKLKVPNATFLIGIDGGGGAGKSTFARKLSKLLPQSSVVEVDDFYKLAADRLKITEEVPIHSNFERTRLKGQVLDPLKAGKNARYQKYDWPRDRLKPDLEEIPQGGFVIVEGLGTLGTELSTYFDYKIWLESPYDIRRKRGVDRDGEEWAHVWDEEYLPEDERYIKEQSPQKAADIIIST